MCFISYESKDIWSSGTNISDYTRSYVIGLGFVGAACTTNRYAIAEERGGFLNTAVSLYASCLLFSFDRFEFFSNFQK
jgi:hypothetical protein